MTNKTSLHSDTNASATSTDGTTSTANTSSESKLEKNIPPPPSLRVRLGLPSETQAEVFRDHIWKRYIGVDYPKTGSNELQDFDRALSYMERVIDRMINKARGILPFNTILIGLIGCAILLAIIAGVWFVIEGKLPNIID